MKTTMFGLIGLLIVMYCGEADCDEITHFEAMLFNGNVIKDGTISSSSSAIGIAMLTLTRPEGDPNTITLDYDIRLSDLDLDGFQSPGVTADDVTAIHFHDVTRWPNGDPNLGSDTAGTLHVLNVFGVPRGGDDVDDMTFDAPQGFVQGIWENSDATPAIPMAPTLKVSDHVAELFDHKLFIMVHNTEFPSGAIGGFIRPVPEPTAFSLGTMGIFVVLGRRCRVTRRDT